MGLEDHFVDERVGFISLQNYYAGAIWPPPMEG